MNIMFCMTVIWSLLLLLLSKSDHISTFDDGSGAEEDINRVRSSIKKDKLGRQQGKQNVNRVDSTDRAFSSSYDQGRLESQTDEWVNDLRRERSRCNKDVIFCCDSSNWTTGGEENDSEFVWPNKPPKEIDYRELGYVSSVDHQSRCKSCWAFTVVGSIEGLMKRATGEMEKLSSQQLLDCTEFGSDCSGGNLPAAMKYAKWYGMQTDASYPYEAQKNECKYDPTNVVFKFTGYKEKCNLSESSLKAYVASVGPIATILVTTKSFWDYKGGIFYTKECEGSRDPDHAILIVGYGYEGARRFWILKNTAGESWGEIGFMRFERKKGLCKIGWGNIWPIV